MTDAILAISGTSTGWWVSPEKIEVDNNDPAGAFLANPGITEDLYANILPNQIPSSATILGFEVTIKRKTGDSWDKDTNIEFQLAGATISANYADPAYWPNDNIYRYIVYGGLADLWGMAVTAADVNSGNLRLRMVFQHDVIWGSIISLDYVEIKVSYQDVDAGPLQVV